MSTTKMNVCDFCDKHAIDYFGISLDMSNGKKRPMPHKLYNNKTPKMTDFKTLSRQELDERRSYAEHFDFIAMDTSKIKHIDCDFKVGIDYDKDAEGWVDFLENLTPFFKSLTKERGRHFLMTSDTDFNGNHRPQTKYTDIEILNGQWSFVKRNEIIHNADKSFYDMDVGELKEFVNTSTSNDSGIDEPKSPVNLVGGVAIPAPKQYSVNQNKLSQILNLIPPDDYDVWTRCVWALKNEDEANYQIAKDWSKQSDKYEDDTFDTLWEKGRHGVTGGTIYFYANKFNPEEYRRIYIKTELSINDDHLSDTFVKLQYDNVIYVNGTVYIYKKNWISESAKNCLQLKKLIRQTLHEYILNVDIDFNKQMIGKQESELREMKGTKDLIKKVFDKVSTKSHIDNITGMVLQDLASMGHNIEFDLCEEQLYNLHFRNGCYELRNKRFRKRTQKDYITQYLDWDYSETVDDAILQELKDFYAKIQPDKTQFKYMMEWLAHCLCGSIGNQKFKMNIGYSAQNGKSTEFKIHNAVFPIYSMKLDNSTFENGYSKRHKQMIHLVTKPIRFAYCEELRSKKLDTDFLKEFVDGSDMNVEVMYGTSMTKTIQAKLSTCSNKDFNLDKDCGIKRRGTVQFYTSKFKDDVEDDYTNHVYNKIKGYEKRFLDVRYKNAYFHILLAHFNEDFDIPESNENAFSDIMNEYDECGSILAGHFELTNDDKDRIEKTELLAFFNEHVAKKYDSAAFLREMKSNGVKYNRQLRVNGKMGVFMGIKRLEEDEDDGDGY
ncbi:MAG: PriCT-2 domain-containing protein [Cyanophyceae cyanobacterium]